MPVTLALFPRGFPDTLPGWKGIYLALNSNFFLAPFCVLTSPKNFLLCATSEPPKPKVHQLLLTVSSIHGDRLEKLFSFVGILKYIPVFLERF